MTDKCREVGEGGSPSSSKGEFETKIKANYCMIAESFIIVGTTIFPLFVIYIGVLPEFAASNLFLFKSGLNSLCVTALVVFQNFLGAITGCSAGSKSKTKPLLVINFKVMVSVS